MNTCRVCHESEVGWRSPLFKYSVRHYAHGSCGIKRWGAQFLDMIPAHELGRLPYLALDKAGLIEEVKRRAKAAA